jgi:uncharacterized membrane protein
MMPTVPGLKVWTAGVGFALGLAGMAFERRWLVWVGVGLLGVAFLLRFAARDRETP